MGLDSIYYVYFLVHTLITVLMDATFIIPVEYQLENQKMLSQFHINTFKDYLAVDPPFWLQLFVAWELISQLPFFIWGAYDYLNNNRNGYSKCLWPMFIIYGFNAAFTSLICVVEILANGTQHGLNETEVYKLAGVYLPTVILPLIMVIDFYGRISNALAVKEDTTTKED